MEQDYSKLQLGRRESERSGFNIFSRPRAGEPRSVFGSYDRNGKREQLIKAILSGISLRSAASICNVNKRTAFKMYRYLISYLFMAGKSDILCKCGQPSIHRGWCAWRFQQSDRRKQFMRKWHETKL